MNSSTDRAQQYFLNELPGVLSRPTGFLHNCTNFLDEKQSDSGFCVLYVAEYFEDRSDVQCLHRWQKVLNPDLKKEPWTKEVSHGCVPTVGQLQNIHQVMRKQRSYCKP